MDVHQNKISGHQNETSNHQNRSYGHQNSTFSHQNRSHGILNETSGHQNRSYGHQNPTFSHQNRSRGHQYPTFDRLWALDDRLSAMRQLKKAMTTAIYPFLGINYWSCGRSRDCIFITKLNEV